MVVYYWPTNTIVLLNFFRILQVNVNITGLQTTYIVVLMPKVTIWKNPAIQMELIMANC